MTNSSVYGVPMAAAVLAVSAGCLSSNYTVTGQVDMVPTDKSGDLTSAPCQSAEEDGIFITRADTLSIRLSSVFVRESREVPLDGSEFLVYAEVYDVQPDDRQRLMKVLFKENNQAAGYLLNQSDRLLFGPVAYTGHPIRIKLFVVELDKEENQIATTIIKEALRVAAAFQPTLASVQQVAGTATDLFATLNQDDVELAFDFTLFPHDVSHGPYLRTGSLALIKTENEQRFTPPVWDVRRWAGTAPEVVPSTYLTGERIMDQYGKEVASTVEDYTSLFAYSEEGHPLHEVTLGDGSIVTPWCVLRTMCGHLWIQSVALEHIEFQGNGNMSKRRILLADPERFGEAKEPPGECAKDGPLPCVRTFKSGGVTFKELLIAGKMDKENKEAKIEAIQLGRRTPYTEKTHAVITISRGGIPSERSLFEELNLVDQELVTHALQPALTSDRIRELVGQLANQLVKAAEEHRAIKTANAAGKGEGRTNGKFVTAFLRQLVPGAGLPGMLAAAAGTGAVDPAKMRDALRNEALLEIVNSFVTDFRVPVDGGRLEDMETKLKELVGAKADEFVPNLTKTGKPDGTFKDAGMQSP